MANSENGSSKTYTDPIHSSEQDSISPSFYKNSRSSNSLSDLEDSASNGQSAGAQHSARSSAGDTGTDTRSSGADGDANGDANAIDQAADAENNPTGLYNSSSRSDSKTAAAETVKNLASGNKLKALKSAKKAGPLGILAILLVVLGAVLMGSTSLAPFAIVNEIIDEMNSSNISVRLRSHVLLKYHMKKGDTPEYTKKKLAAQGIEVETKNGQDVFKFTDSSGTEHTITADNFDDFRKTNVDFNKAYITASSTWRGQSSGWFTKLASSTLSRIGVSRNNLKDAKNDDNATTEERQKKITEITEEAASKNSGDSVTKRNQVTEETETVTDEDENVVYNDDGSEKTNTIYKNSADSGTSTSISRTDSVASVKTKISAKISSFGDVLDAGCTAYTIASVVKAIAYASQHTEMLAVASVFLESINKTQAGDGDAALLNDFMIMLTKTDDDGKSALQSAGIASLFSGSSNSTTNYKSDSGVKLANTNTIISEAMGAVGGVTNASTYKACLAGRAVSDLVSLATSGASAVLFVVGAVTGVAANLLVNAIIDYAVNAITTNVAGNMFGENMGNYVISGAASYLGSIHQGQGGAAGSAEAVAEYNVARQEVIAEEAEYERSIYSPFDASSQYTFFGSIIRTLIPMATSVSSSSVSGLLTQASSTFSSSLVSLTPAADAKNLTNLMQETGDCPDLESVGAVCDIYGNPIYTSDLDTINTDPEKVEKAATVDNDNLEKYQKYCEQRDSVLGTADTNIISEVTVGSDLPDWLSGVPVLSELVDLVDITAETSNLDWIIGQNCVDSSQNTNWDEMKWYQRYDEDQELEKQMNGEFATSSSGGNANGDCPELGNQRTAMWDEASEEDKERFISIVKRESELGTVTLGTMEAYMNQILAYAEEQNNTSDLLSSWLNNQCEAYSATRDCRSTESITDEYQGIIDQALNGSNVTNLATGNASAEVGFGSTGKITCVWDTDADACEDLDYDSAPAGAGCSTLSKNGGECLGQEGRFLSWSKSMSSTCGTTSSLDTDSTDPVQIYEQSNIIAYNPTEESSSDYYLAYDDDGNLSIEYYDDDTTISDADGDGYDDDYVAEIASYSGLTTAEVVETLDLLYTEDDTTLTPAWPLATTTAPATTTVDFTNDAPLSTTTATSNHQYFVSTPHTARTDFATTTT